MQKQHVEYAYGYSRAHKQVRLAMSCIRATYHTASVNAAPSGAVGAVAINVSSVARSGNRSSFRTTSKVRQIGESIQARLFLEWIRCSTGVPDNIPPAISWFHNRCVFPGGSIRSSRHHSRN